MFLLTLVTPQKKLLTDVEIEEVIVPAYLGQLNILPGHAPLMTTLRAGQLKVRLKGESTFKSAAISWGYCEVNPKGINVLADTAEWPEEIDKKRAEDQIKIVNERLQKAGLSPDDYTLSQMKLQKEMARLETLE
ncbi:MAG: ATP synthase F1 subunit epsilon [Bdellovibrionales bacterium RBG_16_40_8]|nr:MAG: ATP synthase F1 subunit epsilon [Bdellovibrionales bacterium RBG_16_40_8]